MRDLINRAARFGIKVYTPIIYQYLGTPESEAGLRKLVRDICEGVSRHPGLRPPDRRLLVQEMGRRSRRQQGVRAGLGAELDAGQWASWPRNATG